jgi:enterochelin esterase-like enzyme
MELQSYESQTTGAVETYSVYLPPQYDATDRRYPVLYLLHGWPYRDANWDTLGADELADQMIADGALPPFIIVMPWATEAMYVGTSGGANSFEAQVIQDLIPQVEATYRAWSQREGRAIGGISRGGVWSLEIAFYHADMFAVVGAHSPALELNRAPPTYDPFYLLDRPRVDALRIYLDAGDTDWAYKRTAAFHTALDSVGLDHVFVVHPGGHAAALWAASLGEYLAFYSFGWPMDGVAP